MQVCFGIQQLPPIAASVVTIGSFDGVHFGHQQIIKKVVTEAQKRQILSIVVSFEPHPRVFFNPQEKVPLLTSTAEKADLLANLGVDILLVMEFNADFANLSAEDYIADFLVKNLSPKLIVIGYDHHFGRQRRGNLDFLKNRSEFFGYEVEEIAPRDVDNLVVSSTKIRNFLSKKQIEQANKLLNHNFSLSGTVVKGQQIGHKIGFPTANLSIAESQKLVPPEGIYVAMAVLNRQKYKAMLYIGRRPTLDNNLAQTIELHIFDFTQDIYFQPLRIELLAHLREDKKLSNLQELTAQLEEDKRQSLLFFENYQL